MKLLFHRIRSFLLFLPLLAGAQTDFTALVNPMTGTGGHGHTFPGATVPFGMVQLSPDTRIDGSWDGCGGYHHSDSLLYGFSHTHLSGTGCSDYGDILLMPSANEPPADPKAYASAFRHADENAVPGYYSVLLRKDSILAELTATTRVGMHRYTFPDTSAWVLLDLLHRDKLLEGTIRIVNATTVEGLRRSEAWARDQRVYYRIEFSQPIIASHISRHGNNDEQAWFRFHAAGKTLEAKVSISAVGEDGAAKNMAAELPHWDFDRVRQAARKDWQEELSKIEVNGGTEEQRRIFYTALYHCFLQPNTYNDVDGRYRGRDMQVHTAEGFTYYTVFSLWDTFRAWHPLMTLIDRKRTTDFIRTFLAQYEQGGLLPVWELSSNETECMIGYHSVSVIADAMVKGIEGFDYEKAFAAMKKSAESRDRYGLGAYIDKGCLSVEDENESVSKTLEYAYDDWCIAQAASLLKHDSDYQRYMTRSQSWKNLFDPQTGFIRPRKNGGWQEPFDPYEVNNQYTEANAWQYTFFVPHEIFALKEKLGGDAAFEKKLDQLFRADTRTTGRDQADITGLIGQYAHGNEPSHHMAYLYNYAGKPWKTNERVLQILNEFYRNSPDGLIGNEDCGQMSAWYVMSAMGLYQVCPGTRMLDLVPPLFPGITLHLENGSTLRLKTEGQRSPNSYIAYIRSDNDDVYEYTILPYKRLLSGGVLTFALKDHAETEPGHPEYIPAHFGGQAVFKPIEEVPSIHGRAVFKDQQEVAITAARGSDIRYTLDGSMPGLGSPRYALPLIIDTTCTVRAYATNSAGVPSPVVTARFNRMAHPHWHITLHSRYSRQYSAGGDDGLIDGVRGEADWKKGGWQGYQGQDFECVVDLGSVQTVRRAGAGFLQDTRAWILMPRQAEFSFSVDSARFSAPVVIRNTVDPKDYDMQVKNFVKDFPPVKARYVKVKAVNFGKLPEWHQGYPYDGDAYIFIDELFIE